MIRAKNITRKEHLYKPKAKAIAIERYARISIPFSVLVIALALICYVILTSVAVWNTAERVSDEKAIAVKTSLISDLESKLSTLNNEITENLARSKGFEETVSVKYITAKPLSQAPSLNQRDI